MTVRRIDYPARRFPATRHSVVTALASADPSARERALATVIDAYRQPVIAVLQRRWHLETADAEDLAHDFFTQALTRDWLARYDPARGRFRTFIRTCLLAFAASAHESATRQKRGGGVRHVPLSIAEGVASDQDIDATFQREWTRSVLTMAIRALHQECAATGREASWRAFQLYDLDVDDAATRPTYADIAHALGVPPTQVTNFLNWTRRRFRTHVLATLRELTTSEAEYRDEVRELLGRNAL